MVHEDTKRQRAAEFDRLGIKHVPCGVCGLPTMTTATARCDGCLEVEHRLADYLLAGGEAAFRFVNKTVRAVRPAHYREVQKNYPKTHPGSAKLTEEEKDIKS